MTRATTAPRNVVMLSVLVAVVAILAGLVIAIAAADDSALHPWWDTATLVVLLVVPYLLAIDALLTRHRHERGLLLVVAGVGSLVPALLTLTVLIGSGLAVLAVVLVAMGISMLLSARPAPRTVAVAVAAIALLLASPFARFASTDERCVRVTRDASGVERSESYAPPPDSSGPRMLGPDVIREECTSDAVTAEEAAASVALSIGGASLAVIVSRDRHSGRSEAI